MTDDAFQKMKSLCDSLRREADRAEGVCSSLRDRIESEFGAAALVEGRQMVVAIRSELADIDQQILQLKKAIQTDFPDIYQR